MKKTKKLMAHFKFPAAAGGSGQAGGRAERGRIRGDV